MYKTFKIKQICFYVNSSGNRLSAAQVKKHVGCDVVINGSLYDMNKFVAQGKIKANKKVYSTNQYTYAGYGWNNGTTNLVMTSDMDAYDNYLSCICLINYGQKQKMYGTAGLEGVRGRTAIGFKKDGTMVVYVAKDGQTGSYGACTLETLQDRMLALGCYTALNLDGGGSSQYESDTEKITSSRKVHNYLCIWLKDEEEKKPAAPAQPTVQTQTAKTYKVNASALNVRKGPGTGYVKVGILYKGATFTSTKVSDGWVYVDNKAGWVSGAYVSQINNTQANTTTKPTTTKYKVNTNSARLNVRKGAGTGYAVINSLTKNSIVEITTLLNGWGYIPSLKGWVSMQYMKKI